MQIFLRVLHLVDQFNGNFYCHFRKTANLCSFIHSKKVQNPSINFSLFPTVYFLFLITLHNRVPPLNIGILVECQQKILQNYFHMLNVDLQLSIDVELNELVQFIGHFKPIFIGPCHVYIVYPTNRESTMVVEELL